jgi:hypothetical protein
MFYSVVLLDGKELHCLTLEEVQDLFFKRRINQSSLICTAENPNWQMLKRTFDLSQWIPAQVPEKPAAATNNYQAQINPFQQSVPVNQPNASQAQNNPFAQANPLNQPVTFNQFPANPPNQFNNPNDQNTSNGYSQNNQTETYYQAETNQTNYNFQNNNANFAPSKYSNPANSHYPAANFTNDAGRRRGTKQAAVFLILNAIFYVVYMIFGAAFSASEGETTAYQAGGITGSIVPLIIDLILAVKLWKLDEIESARKWVLARSYFGFIVFGFIFPVISFNTGEIFVGVFSFVTTLFYFISLALVLHGKENPPQSRVMIGMGTFAIYFLVMFGAISLTIVGNLAPNIGQLEFQTTQLGKYKVEGKAFQDKTTGAKVLLPDGWSMISLDNPVIHSPEARMIAVDNAGNRLTMLEVVPVPGNLDMKRQNSGFILDKLTDNVVQSMKEEAQQGGGFTGKNSFNEITRLSIFIGTHPAKLLVFDKTTDGLKAKGHLIITYDELTFYVLHSWCPAAEYENAQNDFTFFEKNFTVPEKINSTFTQSAENEKKR